VVAVVAQVPLVKQAPALEPMAEMVVSMIFLAPTHTTQVVVARAPPVVLVILTVLVVKVAAVVGPVG
jgi:hypothetical protein